MRSPFAMWSVAPFVVRRSRRGLGGEAAFGTARYVAGLRAFLAGLLDEGVRR